MMIEEFLRMHAVDEALEGLSEESQVVYYRPANEPSAPRIWICLTSIRQSPEGWSIRKKRHELTLPALLILQLN